ncbi:MAG: hypothetical protein D3917_19310, partial [Candidatus Electrothrix sp. AX5]|nr:hypothetical protein [Candidatus Electrothrix sp. AX5]
MGLPVPLLYPWPRVCPYHPPAESKKPGLFLIGDPKQAIYSFRGADIFTYIQARQDTPPENR